MPELPEVETIVRELNLNIVGKSIKNIEELRPETIVNYSDVKSLTLSKIVSVNRRGKYIIISTNKEYDLVIHLRMTGKLILVSDKAELTKHTRAIISFNDQTRLLFDDPRTFGKIKVIKHSVKDDSLCKLGCEPFSEEFNQEHITSLLTKKKTSIKNFLLDQRYIAGLGNIYVNEILYASKILPHKITNTLTKSEIKSLLLNTKKILELAIEHNGTSISDYRRVDNKTGSFQNLLKVYGKETCCLGHPVKRVKTNGRSTFYCPQCQKERKA